MNIPFNRPFFTGYELENICAAHRMGQLAGDGTFTRMCCEWLQEATGCNKALLTHSCTAALEMSAILSEIEPGDEIIMPSFTFVSTANAFVLRGGVPVFVDIRDDTLNIDENLIQDAITSNTKVIVVVHYAGVACDMDKIMDIAREHNLLVVEDAAQGIFSTYKGRPLGSIGHLGCYSFHETKNITCGEGGALLINNSVFTERAEYIREKGTNRSRFINGQVDKYTWVDIGSSYLPGELSAAFLMAQIRGGKSITAQRLSLWNEYHKAFEGLEEIGRVRRPIIPDYCTHNGHIYYLILHDAEDRNNFISAMSRHGVSCVFHYVPLHSSPQGKRRGRAHGSMLVTERVASSLVRLPLWAGLEGSQPTVIRSALQSLRNVQSGHL